MEPSTQDLPFVLVHGPWIWKLALVGLTGSVLAIVIGQRWLLARSSLRKRLVLLDHGRESDGVIRGKLGGVGDGPLAATIAASLTYDTDERAHWRADELWVETAEGRVMLAGNLTVELGTDGTARRRRLPKLPEPLLPVARALPRIEDKTFTIAKVLTVKAGDDVVVHGRLERAPSGEDTGFRETSVAWAMHPTSDDEPIRLAARKPRTVLAQISLAVMLVIGGGTAFVGYKIADGMGDRWRQECWDRDRYKGIDGFVTLDGSDACIRTAAMPGQQERAYDSLFYALREHPQRDDRSLARLLALAEKTDGCRGMLDILEEHGRFDDIVVHARRCGLKPREREALDALGRFDEAAKLIDRPEANDINTLIAAQRWTDAAVLADARAQDYRKSPRDSTTDESLDIATLYYRCVGELFRHHAGDAGALARIRDLEAGDHGQVCLPVLVEASPADQRTALIGRYNSQRSYTYDTRRALESQAFLEGTRYPYEYESAERALVRLDDPMGLSNVRLAWIAKLARISEMSPIHRASALRWLAIAYVLDGKHELAAKTATEVTTLVKSLDADPLELYPLSEAALLPATVALYTPQIVDVDIDTAGLEDPRIDESSRGMKKESRYFRFGRLPLRAGRSITGAYFGPDEDYVAALEAAQHGDGLLLANYVRKGRWWNDGDILAVLPHVKAHREQLVAHLPRASNQANWRYLNRTPFELASSAAVRRELLRMIGEDKLAAQWDAIYQRVAKVMDRPRVMAYVLWDN